MLIGIMLFFAGCGEKASSSPEASVSGDGNTAFSTEDINNSAMAAGAMASAKSPLLEDKAFKTAGDTDSGKDSDMAAAGNGGNSGKAGAFAADGDSSGGASPEDGFDYSEWAKENVPSADVSDTVTHDFDGTEEPPSILYITREMQASELKGLSDVQVIEKVGPLFTLDQMTSNILASVSLAQFIKESGFGQSELAQEANNFFGIKCDLLDDDWPGSTWDHTSHYRKRTSEEAADGHLYSIMADFRAYASVQDSIVDHSSYLLGATGSRGRLYEGIEFETDHKRAALIIKAGGYATDSGYVDSLLEIIERYNLKRFDLTDSSQYDLTQYMD